MPIINVKRKFSIELDVKPLLERAGYVVRNIGREHWGQWSVNTHTRLWIEPMHPDHIGLKFSGPDALEIAKVIEKEFPKLDLQVTETEQPKPGIIARVINFIWGN